MDNVININDPQVLNKIPKESHGNIIECLRQYNSVVTKFGIWEKNIEENLITEDKIEYPQMEISIIKIQNLSDDLHIKNQYYHERSISKKFFAMKTTKGH